MHHDSCRNCVLKKSMIRLLRRAYTESEDDADRIVLNKLIEDTTSDADSCCMFTFLLCSLYARSDTDKLLENARSALETLRCPAAANTQIH